LRERGRESDTAGRRMRLVLWLYGQHFIEPSVWLARPLLCKTRKENTHYNPHVQNIGFGGHPQVHLRHWVRGCTQWCGCSAWKARCVRVTNAHDMVVMRGHRSIANQQDIFSDSVSKTHLPRRLPFYPKPG
jgi:hypothetical protein